jgi:hypothetical protein
MSIKTRVLKENIQAVRELRQHPGWTHMRAIMEHEMRQGVSALCNNANMDEKEMHFRRGALWAAEKMINLPENIELRLRNDLLIEESMPATAGEIMSATADNQE